MPPPLTPRPVFETRDQLDSALQQRINALMEDAESQQAQARRRDLRATAHDLEARIAAFANAVDALSPDEGEQPPPAYDQAVVLPGKLRTVVCSEEDYAATPFYWQALASQPEAALHGRQLLAELLPPTPEA